MSAKKVIFGLTAAVVLAAGVAAGIMIAGNLDFSGEEYRLKKTPLVENFDGKPDMDTWLIQGSVVDEDGDPVEEAWVGVGLKGDKKPFVKMETDEKGRYSWEMEDEQADYYLVFQKEDYITVVMEPVVKKTEPHAPQTQVMLLDKEENQEALYLLDFKGVEIRAEELGRDQEAAFEDGGWEADYETSLPGLLGARVEIRSGINCTDGEAELSLETEEDGTFSVGLKKGAYTLVIEKDGFNPLTAVMYAREDEPELTLPFVQSSSAKWQIVLTWEGRDEDPLDLDSLAAGPNRLIDSLNRGDEKNGRYLFDSYGKTAFEMIELPAEQEDYQYYVMDYECAVKGGTPGLSNSGAVVWVYQNGRLEERFDLRENMEKPVWNPFAVKEGKLVKEQKEMDEIPNIEGWKKDKELARMNSKDLNAGEIVSDGEWLYFTNIYDDSKLYYIKKDGTGMNKLCDDRTADSSSKVLDGDWIYYCTGAENGWGNAVWKIKTDGSGREQVKFLDDGQWLNILGKSDGRLFIWSKGKIGGEILYIDDEGKETSLGNGLGNAVSLAGNSLYYFNEAGYDGSSKGLHCRNLKTGEDTLVLPDVDWFQFSIKDGYFYYDEGISLFRMQLGKEPELIASGSEGAIGSFLIHENGIYYYEGGSLYRTGLDGSDHTTIKTSVGWYDIIDGELYTDWVKYDPVKISDLNGENERVLFDVMPFKKDAAAQAYYRFLQENETNGDPEWPSYSSFACLDINGDGLNELFFSVSEFSNFTDSLYSFDGSLTLIENLAEGYKYGGTIVFDEDTKTFAAMYRYGNMGAPDELTLYSTENLYPRILDSGYRYSIGWEDSDPETQIQAVKFDEILADHWVGKPAVKWVENTEENRVNYILNGQTTGYGDVMGEWQ
ncbi:DUF5050 domain-containing protein [Clostridium sp. MCC353]|uniref:DUF5050 domain-containing protein n=1 Tax=Clostridium sp. MCC353 TaxID=2592646 RepID=UPI001C0209D4|nr:DUF5050 domain-containing protein [Clostridium sp. MCC353]MBT9776752.1 DUF5050 domain-containing protein [Clostridium sp. MCC353]